MLYFGRQILVPLALALVLSFLLTPLVVLLEKCRLGRAPAVMAVLTLCFALTAVVAWTVAGQLVEIMVHVGDYKANLEEKIHALHPRDGTLSQATATVHELNKELASGRAESPANSKQAPNGLPGATNLPRPVPVLVTAPPSNLAQDLRAILGPLASPVETGGIVIVFTAFMLIKREDLRNRLIRLGGQGRLNVMTQALDDANQRLSRYLLLQFLVNAGYGVVFGLGLFLIGLPNALLWGTLAALLRFIPYVGTLIATALPTAIAVAVFPGWRHVLFVLAVFLILELLVSNVIEPCLYGAHTGISSLAILVAAVFWATLWGPVGLILSTPLTVCLLLMGRYVPHLQFLEVALGDEPVLSPEEKFYQRLLAMDQEEAREIAEAHLQEKQLESLYESVLLPALRLAEVDRHREALGDQISGSVFQSTRELLEDLADRFVGEDFTRETGGEDDVSPDPGFVGARVICVPANDEADELAGMMLAHLLRQCGGSAQCLPVASVHTMFDQSAQNEFEVACISALQPFAVGHARSLCRRLRARFPERAIVVGLWGFEGGAATAQERLGRACTDPVATTLAEAIAEVRRLAQSADVDQATTTSV